MNVPKSRQCQYPGCRVLTLRRLCVKHRALVPVPQGVWAELERMRDEQELPIDSQGGTCD